MLAETNLVSLDVADLVDPQVGLEAKVNVACDESGFDLL